MPGKGLRAGRRWVISEGGVEYFFGLAHNMQFPMQASSPILTGLMSQQTLGEWECRDVRGNIRGHCRGFFHLRTPPYLLKKKPCLCTCNISTYPKSPHTGFGHRITECFSHSVDYHEGVNFQVCLGFFDHKGNSRLGLRTTTCRITCPLRMPMRFLLPCVQGSEPNGVALFTVTAFPNRDPSPPS